MKSNYIKTIKGLFYMLGEFVLNTKLPSKFTLTNVFFK